MGKPKRRSYEAKVRAELGLPPRTPGQRAMNKAELDMLKYQHGRRQTERVERLSSRGKHLRAFVASLPPMSAIPWFAISPLAAVGAGGLLYVVGVVMPLPLFIGLAVELACLALDGRGSRSMVSEFDDDED